MTRNGTTNRYDTVVVGAGTAGMESALTLGDMGYKVLLVEKEPSVGGKTILLSKVFPTLDCASCISTPKMAASAHHPKVELAVNTVAENMVRNPDGTFSMQVTRKATYVDPAACTGCAQCEQACTVAVPDQYNYDLVARRAAHIAFPQSVPKKSVIERRGTPPCTHTCPAGVKPSGFVSLVRAGKIKEAFELHLEDAPLVGSLSRACYAPCEGECTRGEYEGSVHIRAIKRFMADTYYREHPDPEFGPPETLLNTRVAVIGAGPAGLAAAWHLARAGHGVTVFEAQPEAGGMLRYGMPSYRMPKSVLDRDIRNITALGVEIRRGARISSLRELKDQGYQAIFIGVGGQIPRIVPIAGQDLVGVDDCMNFLRTTNTTGELPDIRGKNIVVIGGGNVAVDVARSALRLGGKRVSMLFLEPRDAMLAHETEVREAEEEGVELIPASATQRIFQDSSGKTMLAYAHVDAMSIIDGELSLTLKPDSEARIEAEIVILAIGLKASTEPFADEIELRPNGTVKTSEETLETSMDGVYAGGDSVLGPSIIVKAMGQGRRAAFHIDHFLRGKPDENPKYGDPLPAADKEVVKRVSAGLSARMPRQIRTRSPKERVQSFEPYEGTFTEEEARQEANRCLDCGVCSQCHQCVKACPADAIHFDMQPETRPVTASSVIMATGYQILDPGLKTLYGYGRYPNVISAPQMDRLLAPTRPYNGVLRPSDGKEPDNIAFVLCNGARDHTVCNPLCCRIGCMYGTKHAQLLMGALPLADITIYYIDIRAFGKGYDEFFEQARGMGVSYVKGKVARIEQTKNHNLILQYEDMASDKGMVRAEHDLVVLSVGLVPNPEPFKMVENGALAADRQGFIREPRAVTHPTGTSMDGLFSAGTASGARDIPDTVLNSGAAATHAAVYNRKLGAEHE